MTTDHSPAPDEYWQAFLRLVVEKLAGTSTVADPDLNFINGQLTTVVDAVLMAMEDLADQGESALIQRRDGNH